MIDLGDLKPDWQSDDGNVVLFNADCLDVLPQLPAGCVDAVVTDPPYGIGEHGGKCRTRSRPQYAKHENLGWDKSRPSPKVFRAILDLGVPSAIWGGNYFADLLPPTMGWLYWRKRMGGDFSDGELAWTSERRALKEFEKCPKGMNKTHPCEKPVSLIAWTMTRIRAKDASTILDPFLGSGTTAVACVKTGRKCIGIEKERRYFDAAVERVQRAYADAGLFTGAIA